MIETESLGPKVFGALLILKQYSIHKCGHERSPIPGADCLLSMVGKKNKKHYIIATQDHDLQKKLRFVPGVPLLYLHQKAPVLEQPTEASLAFANSKVSSLTETEQQTLEKLKSKYGIAQEEIKPKKKKKGPNPLSCLKKKKVKVNQNKIVKTDMENKPKRKKVRIPKHVKEELFRNAINK